MQGVQSALQGGDATLGQVKQTHYFNNLGGGEAAGAISEKERINIIPRNSRLGGFYRAKLSPCYLLSI